MAMLPGLSLALGATPASAPPRTASVDTSIIRTETLDPESEFRFESAFTRPIRIRLLSGSAEIFGTELALGVDYLFQGSKAAIYTWQGCTLQLKGSPDAAYIADEAPSVSQAANVHFALEDLRVAAEQCRSKGPRIMLVGPSDAGKTSLAKFLTAYALRQGRTPVVVNLDPRQGMLSLPGSLSAAVMTNVLDVEEGWGSSPISGPSSVPVKMPLVHHFGKAEPDDNAALFKAIVSRLGLAASSRMEDEGVNVSGMIVDTPGALSSKASGYELIEHVASEFGINVLLVLGSERLLSEMKRRFPEASGMTILKLDKSGGCVERDESYMRQLRQSQIKEYFYGRGEMILTPFTQMAEYSNMALYKVADSNPTSNAWDPGANKDDDEEYDPATAFGYTSIHERIAPSLMLQNAIIAITHAEANDGPDRIRDASVMWYVYVVDVDDAKSRIKFLSPVSGRIPSNAMVWGSWPEGIPDLGTFS